MKDSVTLISDGAANFHHAWKKQWRPKNRTHKETEHHRHIHLSGDMNNNQMESFNGATVRHREKVVRGLKKEDSTLLTGLRIYHNHVRPHLGLEGKTPGEMAGIHIEGSNKWKTIIQNASQNPGSVGLSRDKSSPDWQPRLRCRISAPASPTPFFGRRRWPS